MLLLFICDQRYQETILDTHKYQTCTLCHSVVIDYTTVAIWLESRGLNCTFHIALLS